MASSFTGYCDAVVEELTTTVPALRDVLIHRYAPWDPEQLIADGGERHLAVWPAADAADVSEPLVTGPGGDMLLQLYRIVYWEDATPESSRGVVDEQAAADMLGLIEAIRARFYAIENVFLGDTDRSHYVGTSLPERSGQVRWFQMTVQVRTSLVLT